MRDHRTEANFEEGAGETDQRGRTGKSDWRTGPKRASRGGRKSQVVGVITQEIDQKKREEKIEGCEEEAAVFLPARWA